MLEMATVCKFQLLHYIAASLSLPEFCGDHCWLVLHVSAEPRASGLSTHVVVVRTGFLPSCCLPGELHVS